MMSTCRFMVTVIALLVCACAGEEPAQTHANVQAAGSPAAGSGASVFAIPGLVTSVAGIPSLASLQPMCDASAVSATSCGANACPPLPSGSESSCAINCCTADQRCGTRITDARYAALGCIAAPPPARTDPRCPSSMMFGVELAGCCDAQGRCGQVFGPACVAIQAGPACDASDAGI